ncbi:coiled-coil domain-containing protein [Qipengyuania sp. CAU 1752]
MSGGHHIRAVGAAGEDKTENSQGVESDEFVLDTPVEEDLELYEEWEEEQQPRNRAWLLPSLALAAVLGWTGFFGWARFDAILAGTTPGQWIDWTVQWSVPVLLVVTLWLLVQRNSTREANRYGQVASALSAESQRLETRLSIVNRELSLARDFLGSQGLELESLGRVASERLSEHADRLQSLVRTNSDQVEQIASVSTTALENMDKLRDDLPVIANSARDVANNIAHAGGTAEGQIERLVGGFERLNEFGATSERQVAALSEQVDATLAAFEAQATQMEDITSARFAALREKSEEFRGELDSREVESLAGLRRRADQLAGELASTRTELEEQEEEALRSMRARLTSLRSESDTIARSIRDGEEEARGLWVSQIEAMKERLGEAVEQIRKIDEQALAHARKKLQGLRDEAMAVDAKLTDRNRFFQAEMGVRRDALESAEQQALEALREQFEAIDTELASRRERQLEQARAFAQSTAAVTAQIGDLTEQIESLASQGTETQRGMLETSEALARNLASGRDDITATRGVIDELTEACVRLLELIRASAQHSKDDLPSAIGVAEERLAAARDASETLGVMLEAGVARSEAISNYVISANENGNALDARTDALETRLRTLAGNFGAEISRLRETLATLEDDSERVAEVSKTALRDGLETLQTKLREALALAGDASREEIDRIAAGIGERAAGAVDRAVQEKSNTAIAQLDEAAARSSTTAREAAVQLRDQLSLVNELAGNLENRVALARERAEEQVDNDFARRVALITESLNSNAIDIAKSLSTEVTDTAWTSYLRGDRGIFTRRAVSLLSNSEAREIAELFDADMEFRDHVSRYIHDFEAMLRTMLSTRDGNAIGVTLLSSDMGKLYVALAQAIERLRSE